MFLISLLTFQAYNQTSKYVQGEASEVLPIHNGISDDVSLRDFDEELKQKAKVNAIENEFGTLIFENNRIYIEDIHTGNKIECKQQYTSNGKTVTSGVWLETLKCSYENKIRQEDGQIIRTCTINGYAKAAPNMSAGKTIINDSSEKNIENFIDTCMCIHEPCDKEIEIVCKFVGEESIINKINKVKAEIYFYDRGDSKEYLNTVLLEKRKNNIETGVWFTKRKFSKYNGYGGYYIIIVAPTFNGNESSDVKILNRVKKVDSNDGNYVYINPEIIEEIPVKIKDRKLENYKCSIGIISFGTDINIKRPHLQLGKVLAGTKYFKFGIHIANYNYYRNFDIRYNDYENVYSMDSVKIKQNSIGFDSLSTSFHSIELGNISWQVDIPCFKNKKISKHNHFIPYAFFISPYIMITPVQYTYIKSLPFYYYNEEEYSDLKYEKVGINKPSYFWSFLKRGEVGVKVWSSLYYFSVSYKFGLIEKDYYVDVSEDLVLQEKKGSINFNSIEISFGINLNLFY